MPVGSCPLRAQLASPSLPGIPAFARSSMLSRSPPKLSSPILPEAADLLGAQHLSSYAAGTEVMAAVSEEQPQRPNAQRQAPGRGDQRAARASTPPLSASPRPARPPARGPRDLGVLGQELAHPTRVCPPAPGRRLAPQPGVAPYLCAWVPVRGIPRAVARVLGASGPLPATYRPPCPAPSSPALRVQPLFGSAGKRAPADSGRASAGRPVLRQRAGSNYPLVRLLT
ncbi:hypothetical protein NN561_004873 [Cricetulus griseus]